MKKDIFVTDLVDTAGDIVTEALMGHSQNEIHHVLELTRRKAPYDEVAAAVGKANFTLRSIVGDEIDRRRSMLVGFKIILPLDLNGKTEYEISLGNRKFK